MSADGFEGSRVVDQVDHAALQAQVAAARAAGNRVVDLAQLRRPEGTRGVSLRLVKVGPLWQLLAGDGPEDADAVLVASGPANTEPLIRMLIEDARQTAAARASG